MAKRRNPADATASVQARRNQRQDARIKALEQAVKALAKALAKKQKSIDAALFDVAATNIRQLTMLLAIEQRTSKLEKARG